MFNKNFTVRAETSIEFNQVELLEEEVKEKLWTFLAGSTHLNGYHGKISLIPLDGAGLKETFRRQYAGSGCGKGRDVTETLRFFPSGTKLDMVIEIDSVSSLDTQMLESKIFEFIKHLNNGKIRIGRNTTLGHGRCSCWSMNTREESLEYVNLCDRIEVEANAPEGILIRSQDKKFPYLRDESGRPVIPASTWKGIFRHAVTDWISGHGDDPILLDRMFGNKNRGIKGCLIFYDSIIQNPEEIRASRIHLDKLTGSAMNGELEESIYIAGRFSIRIECLEDMGPYRDYLYTVLRDLHWGRINVGADKGIGRGFIRIRNIRYNEESVLWM